MTNNPTLPKGIFEACNKFYRAFDHAPEQIYVSWHRKVHLPPYVNVPLIPRFSLVEALVENDPMSKPSFTSVPFVAASHKSGLEWEDFALYSAKMGKVKPEDLQPSAELVKRIIESRGYKVLISDAQKSEFFDAFYVFNDDMYKFFVIPKMDYTQPYNPIDAIKVEIDYTLKKFLT